MKRAAAIRYREWMPAPFVVAKEKGALAERMIEIANTYGIDVVEDEGLTESLFLVESGDVIPEELFEVVAELLAYVYRLQGTE